GADGARLEASKQWAKALMVEAGVPTAGHWPAERLDDALALLRARNRPLVVKADGLAAGKGVTVAESVAETEAAIREVFEGRFGAASLVLEERLEGPEVSVFALTDGRDTVLLPPAQDHKRIGEGDTGPNTGGMGAYSPAPVVTPEMHGRIMREVIEPTLRGLAADGTPYTGFLYAGIMIAPDGTPNVLEFNCRFGDPETQPIMCRLRSDLVTLCEAALEGRLDRASMDWDPRAALGVVLAAGGYPETVRKGDAIAGLDAAAALPGKVFHAGTALVSGRVTTAGGRVLCAVGLGDTVGEAQSAAYALVDRICWDGMLCRRDIGHRAIARERATG
ncbi:MAG: phosphoribosylamine--glycine ligase, partial [Gammaproteobacteria bacterium]